jgi:ketosteroid isomerase-like protein
VDKKEKNASPFARPMDTPVSNAELQELYRRIKPEMLREKPSPDAVAAAMEAAQRLAAEGDAEESVADTERDIARHPNSVACKICGYQNREGYKFCGMCGVSVEEAEKARDAGTITQSERTAIALPPNPVAEAERMPSTRPTGNETHHFHHHYHHHYFPGAAEGVYPRTADPVRDSGRDTAREEKLRSTAASLRGDLSRAEAAVRAITQEWVLACNTKHLDDLLELYAPDALVLRSNYPPIRGAAAVREFFFGTLDAGLGEVEIDPLRVDVVGEMAYEAGRCKALIPSSTGKRREERGKYLWVLQRQPNGEWKVVADCWSSDLTLTTLESDVPVSAGVKTSAARK